MNDLCLKCEVNESVGCLSAYTKHKIESDDTHSWWKINVCGRWKCVSMISLSWFFLYSRAEHSVCMPGIYRKTCIINQLLNNIPVKPVELDVKGKKEALAPTHSHSLAYTTFSIAAAATGIRFLPPPY